MATKVNAKPALVATKDEFVCVDRKVYKSSVWQYFGWHKKAIGSCWVVCNICYGWVSRHGNNTSNMRYHITSVHGIKALQQVSVYGIIHLQLYCGYVFMCTAARRRKWAAAAAQTLPVQPLVLDIKYCSKEAVAHPTGKAM